ncbi:MAG: E3 binding domain-containing protein [Chloroflexi bacterium]|nr:E3 binding domain-containing protein [Chloroflexota bacterium]
MAHPILVPPLGQTTDTVVLSIWYKQPGDHVSEGEPLFAIETDKATLDIEAQASGVLARINAQAGESVAVLSEIGVIAAPGELLDSPAEQHPSKTDLVGKGVAIPDQAGQKRAAAPPAGDQLRLGQALQRIFISPRARRLAEAEGVTWHTLAGTGPEGAIVERDVRQYLATRVSHEPVPTSAYPAQRQQPTSAVAPQRAPGSFGQHLSAQTDASALVTLQQRLGQRGIAVTNRDILLYLAGRALTEYPALMPAGANVGLVLIAQTGVVAPLIRDVHRQRLGSLAREAAALSANAHIDTLHTEDTALLLADLGEFGIDLFTPTPGLPDVPTLSMGRIHTQRGGESMWLSLTYNPAHTNPLDAVHFFQRIVQLIEDPDLMFE